MDEQMAELNHMLEARERRWWRQRELLKEYRRTLLSFTMNIAGPVKNSELILRGFHRGQRSIAAQLELAGIPVLHQEESNLFTGNEAFYVLDASPMIVKQLTTEIEENDAVGRLFDMDVLKPDGTQVSRGELRLPHRRCLICGGPARECSSTRAHSVAELQKQTRTLLEQAFQEEDTKTAARLAVQSLLYEVCTTPKPGLVDRNNSGSHRDMDIFTFMASSAALFPYFERCTKIGMVTAEQKSTETMRALRWPGKEAEREMKAVTNGVNTHKGAIFSMGIVCGALGRLKRHQWKQADMVLNECAAMAKGLVERDFAGLTEQNAGTAGQRLYVRYGITGVRGQAEQGFPAVRDTGLPALEQALETGSNLNDAGCVALLELLTAATDTNLIARSDRETQLAVVEQVKDVLTRHSAPDRETLERLDEELIARNLSPGGSADLLALTYFLHFLKELD